MHCSADFRRPNLSTSDHAVVKRWSRAIAAIYAAVALAGIAAAVATREPRSDTVTAQRVPASVTVDRN